MVAPAGAPVSPAELRPLNAPRPVRVEEDAGGRPRAVLRVPSGRRLRVAALRDCWRVDDEWWRDEVSRLYYEAVLEDGRCITLYRDLRSGKWYRQSY